MLSLPPLPQKPGPSLKSGVTLHLGALIKQLEDIPLTYASEARQQGLPWFLPLRIHLNRCQNPVALFYQKGSLLYCSLPGGWVYWTISG